MRTIVTDDHKRIFPPGSILVIIRMALCGLAIAMIATAARINAYALVPSPWHRVPFFASFVLSIVWAFGVHHLKIVLVCTALLVSIFVLRSIELALYAPSSFGFVASVTWMLVAVWCFVLGVINRVVISQKKAGELWDSSLPK